MQNLNIDSNRGNNVINLNITDAIFYAINKYDSHPTILKIKEIMGVKNLLLSFKFAFITKITKQKSMSRKQYTS